MVPLAEKLRPQKLEDFVGQEHIIGIGKPLNELLARKKISSMIFWGPPGSGKTSLARLIANYIEADFIPYSAAIGSIVEVKKIISKAAQDKGFFQKETVLFIDEIHRFNKAQQDAFLPFVENGTIILIGATTENPGFSIIAPLISRSRVYKLEALNDKQIEQIIARAVKEYPDTTWDKESLALIVLHANGDARFAINAVELSAAIHKKVSLKAMEKILQQKNILYDKKGDAHYDTISAFIKSMRGGEPDATLHYLARMIKAGEDPVFIARRMVIFASEDIGNARPNALVLAVAAMDAVKMIGMPESQLILAQVATYLATAPKSIASTAGISAALKDLEIERLGPIPLQLRNPANKVMKGFDYGKGHIRYPWLEEQKTGRKIKQQYLPDNLKDRKYYQPEWE
ncbi:MAG: replication-associated recombination protein A [bacterium]